MPRTAVPRTAVPRAARLVTVGVTLAVSAAALLLTASPPALADPPTPPYRAYVGVGSGTTDDVMNALAGDVAGTTGTNRNIGSYDASGSAQIVTRRGGPAWDRPSNSVAGLAALSDSLLGIDYHGTDLTGQLQFARSAVGPKAAGNALTYVPFARDAVTYAYRGAVAKLGRLTSAQLNAIYSTDEPLTINGVTVVGVLPRAGSDSSTAFLAAIRVTTVGASVLQTSAADNDATALAGVNQVLPFSAAQWIAQRNGVTANTTTLARLGATNGTPAAVVDAGTGQLRPVATYYNSAPFGLNVYNVIPTILVGDGKISRVFVGNGSSVCNAAAKVIVRTYGFLGINPAATGGPACGATTLVGDYTP